MNKRELRITIKEIEYDVEDLKLKNFDLRSRWYESERKLELAEAQIRVKDEQVESKEKLITIMDEMLLSKQEKEEELLAKIHKYEMAGTVTTHDVAHFFKQKMEKIVAVIHEQIIKDEL